VTEKRFSNVVGLDDAPFFRDHRGMVKIVGTVYSGLRFDGVLIGEVEKDGFDSATRLIELIGGSRFAEHIQLIMLQGITLAGFNVVDVFALNEQLRLPVLVVARKQPDMASIREALLSHIEKGKEKWAVLERLGEMEKIGDVFVQRVGISPDQAVAVLDQFIVNGNIPEPLRTAHLIAGALVNGQSRGNV
jgi:endonuclease V-like protein UPF0215 family